MSTVAQTLIRAVLGDGAWEGFPEPAKQMFTGKGQGSWPSFAAASSTSPENNSARSSSRPWSSQPRTFTVVTTSLRTSSPRRCPRRARAGRRRSRHRSRASGRARLRRRGARTEGGAIHRVILVPGGILPADLAYGALIEALGMRSTPSQGPRAVRRRRPPVTTASTRGRRRPPRGRRARLGALPSRRLLGRRRSRARDGGATSGPAAQPRPAPARLGRRLGDGRSRAAISAGVEKLEALPPDEYIHAFVRLELRPGVERPRRRPARRRPGWRTVRPGFRVDTGVRDFRPRPGVAEPVPPARLIRPRLAQESSHVRRAAERLSRAFDDFTLEGSMNDITSIRRTGSSRNGSPVPCACSGGVQKPPSPRAGPRASRCRDPQTL